MQLPPCPECHSEYTWEDNGTYVCPECAHEWRAGESLQNDDEALIVKAAATGDYQALISAFIFNPLCSSDTSGVALVKEMLLANKKYLPLFAKKIESL